MERLKNIVIRFFNFLNPSLVSFQFRIFLAMTFIIFIFIPIMGYFSYIQGKKSIEEQIKHYAISIAGQISGRVQAFFSHHIANVKLIKALIESNILDIKDEHEIIKYFYYLKEDHPAFVNICLGKKNGEFLMVPPQPPEIHKIFDPRIRPWYTGSVKKKGLFWTNVYIFASSQKPGITVSVPLQNQNGVIGVCGIDIDLSTLSKFLEGIKIGRHGYAYIMDNQKGKIIAHPELAKAYGDPAVINLLNACINRLRIQHKRFGTTHYKGHKFFTAYTDYPENNWTIGVTIPVSEFMSDINAIKKATFTVVISAIILSCGLSYLLALTIIKPLKRLKKGIKKISRGELDYKVKIEDRDILGEVARSFNEMALSLKESRKKLKKTYMELAQKEKMAAIGQLTAAVAHEVKNPLGIILGSAQVLQKHNNPPEIERQAIKFIIDEVRHLDKIINTFLLFARPRTIKLKKSDIISLIETTISSIKPILEKKEIRLRTRWNASEQVLAIDRDQIKGTLLNLFLNAVDAMEKGGILAVTTSRIEASFLEKKHLILSSGIPTSKKLFKISISDTGHGIPEEYIDKIFEPFVSLKDKGVGLGLAIVYQTIKLHEGFIEVKSKQGSGTTFNIFLPVSDE